MECKCRVVNQSISIYGYINFAFDWDVHEECTNLSMDEGLSVIVNLSPDPPRQEQERDQKFAALDKHP